MEIYWGEGLSNSLKWHVKRTWLLNISYELVEQRQAQSEVCGSVESSHGASSCLALLARKWKEEWDLSHINNSVKTQDFKHLNGKAPFKAEQWSISSCLKEIYLKSKDPLFEWWDYKTNKTLSTLIVYLPCHFIVTLCSPPTLIVTQSPLQWSIMENLTGISRQWKETEHTIVNLGFVKGIAWKRSARQKGVRDCFVPEEEHLSEQLARIILSLLLLWTKDDKWACHTHYQIWGPFQHQEVMSLLPKSFWEVKGQSWHWFKMYF